MIKTGAFLIGLQEHYNESLMLFRHFLGLFVEELVNVRVKGSLSHPKFEDWHPDDQIKVRELVARTGDDKLYQASKIQFEVQVAAYGGWQKLREETARFVEVNKIVNDRCSHLPPPVDIETDMEVYPVSVCLVAEYRKLGLGVRFGEA